MLFKRLSSLSRDREPRFPASGHNHPTHLNLHASTYTTTTCSLAQYTHSFLSSFVSLSNYLIPPSLSLSLSFSFYCINTAEKLQTFKVFACFDSRRSWVGRDSTSLGASLHQSQARTSTYL